MLAVAGKFQRKPVLFIAIDSGSPRGAVESYVRRNRINWPVIVDADRAYEETCGVPEVSLKNIFQLRILTADGRMRAGSATDLEGSANRALEGAKWNVDPASLPPTLLQAWTGVEFGNYSAAAAGVKKGLNSRKPEIKAAAEKLQSAVEEKLKSQLADAEEATSNGDNWTAYRIYSSTLTRFKGFDIPADVSEKAKTLADDPDVKTELQAAKTLAGAKRLLSSRSTSSRKRGVRSLQKLVADMPETDAAKEAQSLLTQLGVN